MAGGCQGKEVLSVLTFHVHNNRGDTLSGPQHFNLVLILTLLPVVLLNFCLLVLRRNILSNYLQAFLNRSNPFFYILLSKVQNNVVCKVRVWSVPRRRGKFPSSTFPS